LAVEALDQIAALHRVEGLAVADLHRVEALASNL
jgi:hypothetical protein